MPVMMKYLGSNKLLPFTLLYTTIHLMSPHGRENLSETFKMDAQKVKIEVVFTTKRCDRLCPVSNDIDITYIECLIFFLSQFLMKVESGMRKTPEICRIQSRT